MKKSRPEVIEESRILRSTNRRFVAGDGAQNIGERTNRNVGKENNEKQPRDPLHAWPAPESRPGPTFESTPGPESALRPRLDFAFEPTPESAQDDVGSRTGACPVRIDDFDVNGRRGAGVQGWPGFLVHRRPIGGVRKVYVARRLGAGQPSSTGGDASGTRGACVHANPRRTEHPQLRDYDRQGRQAAGLRRLRGLRGLAQRHRPQEQEED